MSPKQSEDLQEASQEGISIWLNPFLGADMDNNDIVENLLYVLKGIDKDIANKFKLRTSIKDTILQLNPETKKQQTLFKWIKE